MSDPRAQKSSSSSSSRPSSSSSSSAKDPRASSSSSSSSAKDPRSASSSTSSSRDPSKDPRAAAAAAAAARDPRASSSSSRESSSSSSRPSSSSSSSSSPSSSSSSATQPYPHITANAWMAFFLFTCLVLIILQGPLGLTGSSELGWWGSLSPWTVGAGSGWGAAPGFPVLGGGDGWGMGWNWNWPGVGGPIGCNGLLATAVPWCGGVQVPPAVAAPVLVAPVTQRVQYQPVHPVRMVRRRLVPASGAVPARDQFGGRGGVMMPNGMMAGYEWHANPNPNPGWGGNQPRYVYVDGQPRRMVWGSAYSSPATASPGQHRQFQYQRPGLQVQVQQGQPQTPPPLAVTQSQAHYAGGAQLQQQQQQQQVVGGPVGVMPDPLVVAPPSPVIPTKTIAGLANLEAAFFPLLVGAIALLVIFDYSS